jgi:1-acyl-sn-glycerol-3-phosphate acyltransferase
MSIPLDGLVSRNAGDSGRSAIPGADRRPIEVQAPAHSLWRYRAVHALLGGVARLYSTVRVEGAEHLPPGPCILCFTHQSWADPFYVFAAVPRWPRMYFFGPEQEEMRRGTRNRLMRWSGAVVPYKPGNRGLVAATARTHALLKDGSVIALAGEGRIHSGERVVLPLRQGPAYLSLRAGVPLVPVSINGTGWLRFRRVVRIGFGMPIYALPGSSARTSADDVARLTARAQTALESLVSDFPDRPRPGRLQSWLTELFNDWPEGARPAVAAPADADRTAGPSERR